MAGYVGGDTALISAGGTALGKVAVDVGDQARPMATSGRTASGAAGDPAVAGALERCSAAWSRLLADTATQTTAIGKLSDAGASDLELATGS